MGVRVVGLHSPAAVKSPGVPHRVLEQHAAHGQALKVMRQYCQPVCSQDPVAGGIGSKERCLYEKPQVN